MKRVLKSRIFTFILGAVIFSGLTVIATSTITASQITYNNTTLDLALNDLYNQAANSSGGYAALFSVSKGISTTDSYAPVLYSNSNSVEEITDGIKIKEAGNYQLIATASHAANSNTTGTRIYINGTLAYVAEHSIVAYSIINETITLNENDVIKVAIHSDGSQGTKQGATVILIKL